MRLNSAKIVSHVVTIRTNIAPSCELDNKADISNLLMTSVATLLGTEKVWIAPLSGGGGATSPRGQGGSSHVSVTCRIIDGVGETVSTLGGCGDGE